MVALNPRTEKILFVTRLPCMDYLPTFGLTFWVKCRLKKNNNRPMGKPSWVCKLDEIFLVIPGNICCIEASGLNKVNGTIGWPVAP